MALLASHIAEMGQSLPAGLVGGFGKFEAIAHDVVCGLHNDERLLPEGDLKIMANRLLHSLLHYLGEVYDDAKRPWNKEHHVGPFSQIQLQELSLLARRDAAVEKKYGQKQIERVFEQQLALIVQSLGLLVVPARTGERSVDLICISSDASRVTFLLEAKTSAKPYTLPVKDERALLEYIEQVQTALTSLPRLDFVLIVSGEPSKTLSKKLRSLEGKSHVPIRFCRAQDLAELREMSVGPLPIEAFRDDLIGGPHVPPRGFVGPLVKKYEQLQLGHTSFVREMFDVYKPQSAGEGREHEDWPTEHGAGQESG
jgi:hypothetical protein